MAMNHCCGESPFLRPEGLSVPGGSDIAAFIFQAAPDAILLVDRRGVIVEANPQTERQFGFAREELIGEKIEILIPHRFRKIHSRQRGQYHSRPHSRPFGAGVELYGITKTGEEFPVDISLSPIETGSGHFVVAVIRDISHLTRLESDLKHFQSLVANISDVITLIDRAGVILEESASLEKVLGYKPHQRVGKKIFSYLHQEDREKIETLLEMALSHPGRVHLEVVRVRRADGTWAYLEAAGMVAEDGPADILAMTSRDLTERMQAENDLEESRAQLHQSQKMEAVGRLAEGIAHDFNNLLTVILGHIHAARTELEPEHPVQLDLESAESASGRCADLTRRLLAFGRKQELQPQVIHLNQLVEEAENLLRRVIGEEIELVSRLAPDPAPICIDPSQLQQVILNLAVNAKDAMPRGGTLILETRRIAGEGGDLIRFSVTDTGDGIEPETVSRIFEPFFTTKEPGKGTGLGLFVVYGIIKQSQGKIAVETEPGKGTTFHIDFPAIAENPPSPDQESPEGDLPPGDETIFLIEDEPSVRRITVRMLKGMGYKIVEAEKPIEARRVFSECSEEIDLIISDIRLPEMPGPALARELLEIRPDLSVLFISGCTKDLESWEGPLHDPLEKPFTYQQLADRVRAMLSGSRNNRGKPEIRE